MIGLKTYLGREVDYRRPAGEPGLCGPDSVSWQIFKNPITLAIGGTCAVLLELADPKIRTGVWDHSDFKDNPAGRAQRTATAALIGVYGPKSLAMEVIQRVSHMHAHVHGSTPSGMSYQADDPALLQWVGATAAYGFFAAYDRFFIAVPDTDQKRFLEESAHVGALYGASDPVLSPKGFELLLEERFPKFESHPIVFEFLDIMCRGKAAPWAPKRLQRMLVHAAVSIVPKEVKTVLKLGTQFDLSRLDEMAVRSMAAVAGRVPDPTHPAARASQRYGLPWNFVWMSAQRRDRILQSMIP